MDNKKAKYIILGIIIGFFVTTGIQSTLIAKDYDTYRLGSQFNPMHVRIVD